MRLHRLIAILLLIESRGHMKARELAEALETSVRTIYRDIDTLCESGVPLVTTTGPNGGIYLMDGYQLAMKHLYGDDVINLYLCGIGIRPEGHSEAGIKLQNTLLKLEKSLPLEYLSDIRKARERFYYDELPWWGEHKVIPALEVIRRAVWQSKKLLIRYGRRNEEDTKRSIRPYGMIVKNMEWYLAAFCERSSEVRTFKCDRILEAELVEETFLIPVSFSLDQYWKVSEDKFKAELKKEEIYPVTIKLLSLDADLLNTLEVKETWKVQDYIYAIVNMHKYEFACGEAMEILGRAEILEPPALRSYLKEKIDKISRLYS